MGVRERISGDVGAAADGGECGKKAGGGKNPPPAVEIAGRCD